jgi:hypothetical protein
MPASADFDSQIRAIHPGRTATQLLQIPGSDVCTCDITPFLDDILNTLMPAYDYSADVLRHLFHLSQRPSCLR